MSSSRFIPKMKLKSGSHRTDAVGKSSKRVKPSSRKPKASIDAAAASETYTAPGPNTEYAVRVRVTRVQQGKPLPLNDQDAD